MRRTIFTLMLVSLPLGISWWSRPSPLPLLAVRAPSAGRDGRRCAECHEEHYESLTSAPHFRTLTPANDPLMLERYSGGSYEWPTPGPRIRFAAEAGELWMHSDAYPKPLRIDWIFGSGTHAQTPVSVWTNTRGEVEAIQHRVSWYPNGQFGPTLEMNQARDPHLGLSAIGDHTGHADTLECFGCHVTEMSPEGGAMAPDDVVAGLRCARCHPGGEAHIASVENDGPTKMEHWADLSPLESINRCGECHRRADQLTKADLDPERIVLVRFAPVGLAMSACFQGQPDGSAGQSATMRLDCLTCHDPHRASERDPAFFVAKCLACHGSELDDAPVCAAEPMTSGCLNCHMPKVEVEENLAFTDHWIRIRRNTPSRHEE